jgi:hypothetical protein
MDTDLHTPREHLEDRSVEDDQGIVARLHLEGHCHVSARAGAWRP